MKCRAGLNFSVVYFDQQAGKSIYMDFFVEETQIIEHHPEFILHVTQPSMKTQGSVPCVPNLHFKFPRIEEGDLKKGH